MEERVPPATADNVTYHDDGHHDEDYNQINEPEGEESRIEKNKYGTGENMQTARDDNPPPPSQHEMYIIQIPRDQVYRVPPPENAKIVQRYQKPAQKKKRSPKRCLCWFLSIFFGAAFLISIIVCIQHFTLNPKAPSFAVKHLVIYHSPSSKTKKSTSLGFQLKISVDTTNPNSVNDLGYEQGAAFLSHKGKQIAKGDFPPLDHDEAAGKTESVDVILVGSSKAALPKDNSHHVMLNLSMSIPIKMRTWLWTKIVDIKVQCNFEANSLGDNAEVLSQKCDTVA